jgi:hypothetical protein
MCTNSSLSLSGCEWMIVSPIFSVKDTEESLFAWEMRLDVRSAVESYYIPL